MNWLANNINEVLTVIFSIVQLLALAIVWIYMFESNKTEAQNLGNKSEDVSGSLFWLSVIALFVLWFCVPENSIIVGIMLLSAILWLLTAIGIFVYSIIARDQKVKSNIRSAMMKAFNKVVLLAIIVWFIHN